MADADGPENAATALLERLDEREVKDWDAWGERYERKIDHIVARQRALADRVKLMAEMMRRSQSATVFAVISWLKP